MLLLGWGGGNANLILNLMNRKLWTILWGGNANRFCNESVMLEVFWTGVNMKTRMSIFRFWVMANTYLEAKQSEGKWSGGQRLGLSIWGTIISELAKVFEALKRPLHDL